MIYLKSLLLEQIDIVDTDLNQPIKLKVSKLIKNNYSVVKKSTNDITDSSKIIIYPDGVFDSESKSLQYIRAKFINNYIILKRTDDGVDKFVVGVVKDETVDSTVRGITSRLRDLYYKGIQKQPDGSYVVYGFAKFESLTISNIATLLYRNVVSRLSESREFSDIMAKLSAKHFLGVINLTTEYQVWYVIRGTDGTNTIYNSVDELETYFQTTDKLSGMAYCKYSYPADFIDKLTNLISPNTNNTNVDSSNDDTGGDSESSDTNSSDTPGFNWFYDAGYDKVWEYKRDKDGTFYTREHGKTKEYNLTAILKKKKNPKLKTQLDDLETNWNILFNTDGTRKLKK